ncbi:MAG: helix-turn-helix transcriptional regulator [Deltaproteobacteria bacterium]
MPGLSQRQSRQLLDILERIYAAQTFPEFTTSLLTSIGQIIPAIGVTYNEMDMARRKTYDVILPVPPRLDEVAQVWPKHLKEQPVMNYFMKHRDRRPLAISDFISQRQMHNLGMYCEVFRQLKTEDALCIALEVKGSTIIGMGVGRDRRGFADRERLAFGLLRPHIAQAWRNVRAITELRRRMESLNATLTEMGVGIIELDRGGHFRAVSPEARALLSRYSDGSSRLARERIPEELRSWIRQVQSRESKTGVPPRRAPFVLESERGRLTIRLIGDGSRLLLREQPKSVSACALQGLGLTPRECEVLAWITEGKSNAEIAVILGMSTLTVKRHVEEILQRLGVETRTAAASVALHAAPYL